jgi:hypothetical protein
MTVRALYPMLTDANRDALRGDAITGVRSTAEPVSSLTLLEPLFVEKGLVTVVLATGLLVTILRSNQSVTATQVTDEPIEADMYVWISKTVSGAFVVHGSVKG